MNRNWLIGGLASFLMALAGVAIVQGGGGEGAAPEGDMTQEGAAVFSSTRSAIWAKPQATTA